MANMQCGICDGDFKVCDHGRIAALEAEVTALEDEILDCPAEGYHTRDKPHATKEPQ
jgi:hypothetical protein